MKIEQPAAAEIPLHRTATGHLLTHVALPHQTDLVFIVDSGASTSVISASAVPAHMCDLIRIDTDEEVHAAGASLPDTKILEVDRLDLGPHSFSDIQLIVLDLDHLTDRLGVRVAGILGLDILEQHAVWLDLTVDRLLLLEAHQPIDLRRWPQHEFTHVSFMRSEEGLLILQVGLIEDADCSAILDFGAAISMINSFANDLLVVPNVSKTDSHEKSMALGADNSGIPMELREIDGLKVASVQLPRMRVYVSDLPVFQTLGRADQPTMLLGLDAFRDRIVGIDFVQNVIYLSDLAPAQ